MEEKKKSAKKLTCSNYHSSNKPNFWTNNTCIAQIQANLTVTSTIIKWKLTRFIH